MNKVIIHASLLSDVWKVLLFTHYYSARWNVMFETTLSKFWKIWHLKLVFIKTSIYTQKLQNFFLSPHTNKKFLKKGGCQPPLREGGWHRPPLGWLAGYPWGGSGSRATLEVVANATSEVGHRPGHPDGWCCIVHTSPFKRQCVNSNFTL